jgi:hypothetical protein
MVSDGGETKAWPPSLRNVARSCLTAEQLTPPKYAPIARWVCPLRRHANSMATALASPRPMPFASIREPEAPRVRRPSDRNASTLIPAHSATAAAMASRSIRRRGNDTSASLAPRLQRHRAVLENTSAGQNISAKLKA